MSQREYTAGIKDKKDAEKQGYVNVIAFVARVFILVHAPAIAFASSLEI